VRTADRSEPAVWKITPVDTALARSLPVHPTQLYSAIDAALLCLLLLAFEPWHTVDGQVLALWFTLHPIARFLLESIRTDEPKKYLGMSISQVVSLITLAVAATLWGYLWSKRPSVPAVRPQVIPG
jgi:phosphatidylglycerol:prolipoprotein diacylglycerol transferase